VAKRPTRQQRIATYYMKALPYAAGLSGLGWLFGWHSAVSALCPADTLASGTIGGGFWWLVIGSSFVFVGSFGFLTPIEWFIPAPKRPHLTDIVRAQRRRDLAITGCLLAIALLMAVTGLSFSFCARPQGIFVRATPFGEGKNYAWTDVSKITAHCMHGGRGSIRFHFDADMNDGQTIPLGASESQFVRDYPALSDAVRDVPFIYDNSRMSDCRPSLRDLLATRPGAHVNEPH